MLSLNLIFPNWDMMDNIIFSFIRRLDLISFGLIGLILLSSCSTKLVVQSEPPQADVYITVEGRNEPIKAGQTPFELTEIQIQEMLKLSPATSTWIKLIFEKKDYEKLTFWVPSNRWGESSKIMKAQLKAMDDPTTVVVKMIRYFFNAKKFAESKQYEAAHAEIDKVLQLDSRMPQALNMKAGIYFLQGNLTEARSLYKKALEIDPGSNDAIQMLEKIQNKSTGSNSP